MALDDETAVAEVTEDVKPEAEAAKPDAKDDAEKAQPEKAEEPEKADEEKPKRANRYREMQTRAETAEARQLAEARRGDRLERENAELRKIIEKTDDFDIKQRAEIRLALNENEQERTRESFVASENDAKAAVFDMFQARVSEAAERIPDLIQVLNSDAFSQTAISRAATDVIARSEHGPEVLYHLVKNPIEARRIAALPAAMQGVELARLEHKIISKPPVKKISTAPAPPSMVGGSKAPAAKDPANMSMDEYIAWRKSKAA